MSKHPVAMILACALALSAGAALAQSAPDQKAAGPTTVAPLSVQAAPPPKVIEKQSWDFVQGVSKAPNPEIGQIGRWRDPVCVQVLGLVEAQDALVKARIESVAKAVGLRAAKPDCSANVEIVFNDRPQAVMDQVAQKREYLLGYYHRHDHDRLKTVTRPIQAWYVTATRGLGGPYDGVIDDPENRAPAGCGDSRFTSCYQSTFRNVFVVADSKRLQGQDLGLLSDYLALLALSQPKSLDGCGAFTSVVDALAPAACAGRDRPDGFTPADAAYLTALYQSDLEYRMGFEQSELTNRMARILVQANNANPGR